MCEVNLRGMCVVTPGDSRIYYMATFESGMESSEHITWSSPPGDKVTPINQLTRSDIVGRNMNAQYERVGLQTEVRSTEARSDQVSSDHEHSV